jgi:hypothetical protein
VKRRESGGGGLRAAHIFPFFFFILSSLFLSHARLRATTTTCHNKLKRCGEREREREKKEYFLGENLNAPHAKHETHTSSLDVSLSLSLSRSGVFLLGEGRSRILNG